MITRLAEHWVELIQECSRVGSDLGFICEFLLFDFPLSSLREAQPYWRFYNSIFVNDI